MTLGFFSRSSNECLGLIYWCALLTDSNIRPIVAGDLHAHNSNDTLATSFIATLDFPLFHRNVISQRVMQS